LRKEKGNEGEAIQKHLFDLAVEKHRLVLALKMDVYDLDIKDYRLAVEDLYRNYFPPKADHQNENTNIA
jgi:hypothetical protein